MQNQRFEIAKSDSVCGRLLWLQSGQKLKVGLSVIHHSLGYNIIVKNLFYNNGGEKLWIGSINKPNNRITHCILTESESLVNLFRYSTLMVRGIYAEGSFSVRVQKVMLKGIFPKLSHIIGSQMVFSDRQQKEFNISKIVCPSWNEERSVLANFSVGVCNQIMIIETCII